MPVSVSCTTESARARGALTSHILRKALTAAAASWTFSASGTITERSGSITALRVETSVLAALVAREYSCTLSVAAWADSHRMRFTSSSSASWTAGSLSLKVRPLAAEEAASRFHTNIWMAVGVTGWKDGRMSQGFP